MKVKIIWAIAALSAATLLTGCVSASHVGTFSQAASQAATDISNGFDQIQATTITRKMSDLASDTNHVTDDVFIGLLNNNQMAPRLAYLAELKKYADSLGNLANANYSKNVDSASKDLYGSLNGLAQTYQKATTQSLPFTTNDTAIIATAIDAIGNAIVEYKRQSALRTIILKTDPSIQLVCADFEKTFNGLHQDQFIYQNLESVVADLSGAYNEQTVRWNYAERMTYLTRIQQARIIRDNADAFIVAAAKSAGALAKAHKALADAAKLGKLDSAETTQAIGELVDEANQAKRFYDNVRSGN